MLSRGWLPLLVELGFCDYFDTRLGTSLGASTSLGAPCHSGPEDPRASITMEILRASQDTWVVSVSAEIKMLDTRDSYILEID